MHSAAMMMAEVKQANSKQDGVETWLEKEALASAMVSTVRGSDSIEQRRPESEGARSRSCDNTECFRLELNCSSCLTHIHPAH